MKKNLLYFVFVSLACMGFAEARFYVGIDAGYSAGPRTIDPQTLQGTNEVKFVSVPSSDVKMGFKNQTFSDSHESATFKPISGYNIGINFGSEHLFFRNYFGLRWGVALAYSDMKTRISSDNIEVGSSDIEESYSFLDTGLSVDAMVNFYNSQVFGIGMFGGVELGYHYMLSGKYKDNKFGETLNLKNLVPSRHSLDLVGRVGITTMIVEHHRIEVLAKLPIGYIMAGKASNVKLAQAIARTTLSAGYKFVF